MAASSVIRTILAFKTKARIDKVELSIDLMRNDVKITSADLGDVKGNVGMLIEQVSSILRGLEAVHGIVSGIKDSEARFALMALLTSMTNRRSAIESGTGNGSTAATTEPTTELKQVKPDSPVVTMPGSGAPVVTAQPFTDNAAGTGPNGSAPAAIAIPPGGFSGSDVVDKVLADSMVYGQGPAAVKADAALERTGEIRHAPNRLSDSGEHAVVEAPAPTGAPAK